MSHTLTETLLLSTDPGANKTCKPYKYKKYQEIKENEDFLLHEKSEFP
jgi:hypothetical protein